MKTYRVALYPGDGIGPEVLDQAMRVLTAVQPRYGFTMDTTRFSWGAEHYLAHGRAAPADFLDVLRPFDAIFLGALGDPKRVPEPARSTR